MTELPPWSHTNLSDAANCLWKYYRKHVGKDLPKEEKSKEQALGIHVHQAFETAINKRSVSSLPEVYQPLAAPMVAMNARAEVKYGVSRDGEPAEFFGKPWGRGVLDVLIVNASNAPATSAILFDWKTGRVREDPRELMAQSYLLQANYPTIKTVRGAYVWLVENRLGEMHDLTNTGRWLNGTRATLAKAQEALESGFWPKSPNPLCGWCPCKDCEHNRS